MLSVQHCGAGCLSSTVSAELLAETPLYVLRRRYQTAEIRDAVLRLEARNQKPVLILVDFIQMLRTRPLMGGTRPPIWGRQRSGSS
jgi:hypothetical protein